jgi:hypothetical protein
MWCNRRCVGKTALVSAFADGQPTGDSDQWVTVLE